MIAQVAVPSFDLLTRLFSAKNPEKPNVLVLGYGWGGKSFCDQIDRSKFNVTIVNKTDSFLNTPKLVQFNELEKATQKINEPNLVLDEVKEINPKNKLIYMNNSTKHYDYLVVSTGSIPNTFGIQGAETCQFYKTVEDAKALKESLDSKTNYQIIGAGPTGIEVAFELAAKGKKVTLIEAADKILPQFSDAVREKVLKKLKEKDIELLLEHKVIMLDNLIIKTSKRDLPRHYTLWMSGIKPTALVSEVSKVNEYLQHNNSTYVIGDSIRGHGPPTAQNAKQQGIYLAKHFNAGFKSLPYKYNEWCKMLHTHDVLLIDYNNKCYSLPLITVDLIENFLT